MSGASSDKFVDYYALLDVSSHADTETIKKAFRTAAMKQHPDKRGGDDAEMKRLNIAREILGDPVKRRAYDQCCLANERETLLRRVKTASARKQVMTALVAAKALYERFPDDLDCNEVYMKLCLTAARMLIERHQLSEAKSYLDQVIRITKSEDKRRRAIRELENLASSRTAKKTLQQIRPEESSKERPFDQHRPREFTRESARDVEWSGRKPSAESPRRHALHRPYSKKRRRHRSKRSLLLLALSSLAIAGFCILLALPSLLARMGNATQRPQDHDGDIARADKAQAPAEGSRSPVNAAVPKHKADDALPVARSQYDSAVLEYSPERVIRYWGAAYPALQSRVASTAYRNDKENPRISSEANDEIDRIASTAPQAHADASEPKRTEASPAPSVAQALPEPSRPRSGLLDPSAISGPLPPLDSLLAPTALPSLFPVPYEFPETTQFPLSIQLPQPPQAPQKPLPQAPLPQTLFPQTPFPQTPFPQTPFPQTPFPQLPQVPLTPLPQAPQVPLSAPAGGGL